MNTTSCETMATANKPGAVSFFEFWPTWVMYLPVAVQWLALAAWHRSFTLPLLANPRLPLAGMVGGSKAELMAQAQAECEAAILDWVAHDITGHDARQQAETLLAKARTRGIELPLVCKPDMGCRGAGVKLIREPQQLVDALAAYPVGARVLLQKLASHTAEAGIFYVRHPGEATGRVVSLTLKQAPSVTGDGVRRLCELVAADPRAGQLLHLYERRNQARWQSIPAEGETVSLLFSASHCRGAVFRDGRQHITPALEAAIERLMRGLPDFHYGRLDAKYRSLAELERGEELEIVEINGASAEAIHIWDRDARLGDALKTLLWQYRTLFAIGARHRRNGLQPPPLRELLERWRLERRLTRAYPDTD